jgi:hypothetical protein
MSRYKSAIHFTQWFSSPEWNVAVFAFLLSFFWEIQQMPFYQIPPERSCFEMVRNCTLATVGDVAIMLVAFWVVAAVAKSRQWVRYPNRKQICLFTLIGVLITIVFEGLATRWLGIWAYADSMITIPILGTGLVPLLMWVLIPPLTIWFVKRQAQSAR